MKNPGILGLVALAGLLGASAPQDSIYYRSQSEANAALAAFDREHPDCAFWSNWQKACSRTGPYGASTCVPADMVGVRPSAPFCLARIGEPYTGPLPQDSEQARRSFVRFCEPADKKVGDAAGCRWTERRSFNGLRRSEMKHPWCAKWSAPRDGSARRLGYTCSERRVPSWCTWPEGLGFGGRPINKSQGTYIPATLDPFSRAVHGVYCRRSNLDAR